MVSKVISTLIGVISIVTLVITLVIKSHDPLNRGLGYRLEASRLMPWASQCLGGRTRMFGAP